MRIEVETDGSTEHTRVWLNGRLQEALVELDFTFSRLRAGRGGRGKPCLHLVTMQPSHPDKIDSFSRYFGNDFLKFDQYFPAEPSAVAAPGGGA